MAREKSRVRNAELKEKAKKPRNKRKRGRSELSRINQLARAAGMSYGKYVELELRGMVRVERSKV